MPAESLPEAAPGRVDPEAFRAAVERAGLGSLPEADLSRLRHFYDGWRAQVGRPFDETTVFRVAGAYERATPWHTMHPRGA